MPSAILCSLRRRGMSVRCSPSRPDCSPAAGGCDSLTGGTLEDKVRAAGVEFLELPPGADTFEATRWRPTPLGHRIAEPRHQAGVFRPGPLPANALAAEFIPHDMLLPKTDVFVTNGGYGALHYAMATGTPVVVAGDTEDKPETSARVAWSGIGINLKTGRPKSKAILTAVRKVLADRRYAQASARIGAAIERSPGVDGLADVLEPMIADRRPA